jgi:Flp pilus assembly protein TadD
MQNSKPAPKNNDENIPMCIADTLGMDEKKVAALMMVGFRLYKNGRLKDATRIFEGLAVLKCNNAYVQGILGAIYQKQEQYGAALVRYNNALTLFPNDLNSLTNRGEIFVKLGRFRDAAEDLKKAIQLDPEKKDPASNRARLLVSMVHDALTIAKTQGISALGNLKK